MVEEGLFSVYIKTSSLLGENTKNVFDYCIKLKGKDEQVEEKAEVKKSAEKTKEEKKNC